MKNTTRDAVLLLGLATGLVCGTASADTIRLRNGNALQGEALVLPNGDVEVHSAMGVWTVKASRVLEVVQSQSPEERVASALAQRPPMSPDALFDLALEVRREGSVTLSQRLLERVVAAEPDHSEARHLLGQRKLGDTWMSEEEYHLARGEVLYRGQWVDPEKAASLLELEALEAMRERAEAERQLQDAQRQLVYEERLLRMEEMARYSEPGYGFPVDAIWGYGYGVPYFPVFSPFPDGDHGRPGVNPRPPRPMPAPPPSQVAPRHNRSSKVPGG